MSNYQPPPPPSNCGRRLVPCLVDEIATNDPGRIYASVPNSSDLKDGWRDITYRSLAIAVSRAARWIEQRVGRSSKEEVLCYMGPLDLRYPIVLFAAVKTGHVVQFSSTRNSLEAHLSLLGKTNCKAMLLPKDAPAVTAEILAREPRQVVEFPTLEYLLTPNGSSELYRWNPSFDEMRNKTCVVLHTSGSTGIPKPVYVAHGTFASNDMHQAIPSLGGKPAVMVEMMRGKRVFVSLPLFHAACVGFYAAYCVFTGATIVIPPTGPLTKEVVDYTHVHAKVEGSVVPPSVLVDIYKSPSAFQNMIKNIKFISYGGGSLDVDVGNKVAKHIKLITLLGSTETAFLPVEVIDEPEKWQQIPISPFAGVEYVPSRDGLKELVIKRNPLLNVFQGIFCTFPEKDQYSMGDLYIQDPTNPRYWSFAARADDLIVFSNAEKLNPVTIEATVSSHPRVSGAMAGGHKQFQASLLVEPSEPRPQSDEEAEQLIAEIWPTIMKANRDTVGHGRIMRDFVFLTDPGRPLPRAPKGTIQRYAATKLYENDFRELYARRAAGQDGPLICQRDYLAVSKPSVEKTPSREAASPPKHRLTVVGKSERGVRAKSNAKVSSTGRAAHVVNVPSPRRDASADVRSEVSAQLLSKKLERLDQLAAKFDGALFKLERFLNSASSVTQPVSFDDGAKDPCAIKIDAVSPLPELSRTPSSQGDNVAQALSFVHSDFTEAYVDDGNNSTPSESAVNSVVDEKSHIQETLRRIITENTFVTGFTDTSDLFNSGLDSLQIPVLVKAVNKTLPAGRRLVEKDFFQYRTIEQLASAVM